MNRLTTYLAGLTALVAVFASSVPEASAQAQSSSSGIVRRRADDKAAPANRSAEVTDRMQQRFETGTGASDADKAWMRVVYRQLDLDRAENAPLYYPVDIIDGEENLFRILMRLLMDDRIAAYEYLDGREIFEPRYRLAVRDLLEKCYIPYTEAKGSTEKSPRFTADEADIPAAEVLRYYVIEQWDFDRRNNRLQSSIVAICPVLMRTSEYTSEPEPMPLFWVKYADLRPHLMTRAIFMSDHNNLPTGTYDDFFTLNRYNGEIYKTRNLRNLTMAQLYPDPEERKAAQDSIQNTLDNFDKKLWVPSLDELAAAQEGAEGAAQADSTATDKTAAKPSRSRTARAAAKKSSSTVKKAKKEPKTKTASASSATRSVRNRRK